MRATISPWEFDRRDVTVIAIGSQLVYGSVGNNAAGHQFDQAGLRRITVPTVLLTNLPHYPSVHAVDIPNEWLTAALGDIEDRGLLETTKFITVGFLATPDQALIIGRWLTAVKSKFPAVTVIVDPTMGDDDVGIYTAPGLALAHLKHLVPLADGVVPNRFELELLAEAAGWQAVGLDVIAAGRKITELGPQWAVVTSATGNLNPDEVVDTVVTKTEHTSHHHVRVKSAVKGAGDHFSAALIIALATGDSIDQATLTAARAVADQLTWVEN